METYSGAWEQCAHTESTVVTYETRQWQNVALSPSSGNHRGFNMFYCVMWAFFFFKLENSITRSYIFVPKPNHFLISQCPHLLNFILVEVLQWLADWRYINCYLQSFSVGSNFPNSRMLLFFVNYDSKWREFWVLDKIKNLKTSLCNEHFPIKFFLIFFFYIL